LIISGRDGIDVFPRSKANGYFPSCPLGALNAAQFSAAVREMHPDWHERLQRGDVAFVRRWLAENVWQKGCGVDAQALVGDATGEATQSRFVLDHLRARYLEDRY